jgi:glutamate formiminotransferase/formiminotetrahydrofolate cyclodeaminase
MGAALGTMVGFLTYGKRQFDEQEEAMRRAIPPLHRAMKALVPLIDADTAAFEAFRSARALPSDTDERRRHREHALQAALVKAVEIPLEVMRLGDRCWDGLLQMARHGNIASRSDLEVGAKALEAGIWGAHRNVLINLPEVADQASQGRIQDEADALVARAVEKLREVVDVVAAR